jgi:soluble lytic murein transglycosylase-like protein
MGRIACVLLGLACALAAPTAAHAGAQTYEPLSASVRAALNKSVSDQATPFLAFEDEAEARRWLAAMSKRLARRIPDRLQREELLVTVHYEAKRAGLDPQLVLGLIQVESNFRKYAVSSAGARGFMQVMPFWIRVIGGGEDNLFHLRTNLRYGCVILRHYLDIERGNLFRALGRYNGSLGKPEYPALVERAWQRDWHYAEQTAEGRSNKGRADARGGRPPLRQVSAEAQDARP